MLILMWIIDVNCWFRGGGGVCACGGARELQCRLVTTSLFYARAERTEHNNRGSEGEKWVEEKHPLSPNNIVIESISFVFLMDSSRLMLGSGSLLSPVAVSSNSTYQIIFLCRSLEEALANNVLSLKQSAKEYVNWWTGIHIVRSIFLTRQTTYRVSQRWAFSSNRFVKDRKGEIEPHGKRGEGKI